MAHDEVTEQNQYCVSVKVYVWADNKADAADKVYSDLVYLTECDGGISGFEHPTENDAEEDNLP